MTLPLCSVYSSFVIRLVAAIALASISLSVSIYANEPVVRVQKVDVMPMGDVKVETLDRTGLVGDVDAVCDVKLGQTPRFNPLDEVQIAVRSDHPFVARYLAFPRVGFGDWALPSQIRLTVNGVDMGSFSLEAERIIPGGEMGAVDMVDLGEEVMIRDIRVAVEGVDSSKGNRHGVLKVLAAVPSPLSIKLEETGEVPMDSVGIELVVEASDAVEYPSFGARAYQFRRNRETVLSVTPLVCGTNTIQVYWDELQWPANLPSSIEPINIKEFFIRDEGNGAQLDLKSWRYLTSESQSMQPAWAVVKAHDFQADEQGWRPGIPTDGFGRFGWIETSGLLVGGLGPDGFSSSVNSQGRVKTHSWTLQFGDAHYREWGRTRADWVSVRHESFYEYTAEVKDELEAKAPQLIKQKRSPQLLMGSILAPGMLADSQDQKVEITLRPDSEMADGGRGWIAYATEGKGLRVASLDEKIDGEGLAEGWFVVAWPGALESPVLFAPKMKPVSISFSDMTLTVDFGKPLERIGIAFPYGFYGTESKGAPGDVSLGELASQSREVAAILRAYPFGATQSFREVENGTAIEVEDTVRHLLWENEWGEPSRRVAPISPLLNFASDMGYPVELPADLKGGLSTKYGPYGYVDGNRVRYRMNQPPMDTRVYLAPPAIADARVESLANEIASLPESVQSKAWMRDALQVWWMWAPASLAFPMMDSQQQQNYLKAWRQRLEWGLSAHAWYVRREPFSGAVYPVSFGWIQGSTQTLGDVNSGVGAVLYGLWAYARCSGDWEFVRSKWPIVRGALEYYLMESDWCLMGTGAREYNASSAIDMDGISFEGAVAYASMAEELGLEDEAAFGRFLATRLAMPTCMRWIGIEWLRPEQSREEWHEIGIGYGEFIGMNRFPVSQGNPDHINSEVALCLAWVGEYPELYDLHRWGLGDDFWEWFEGDFVENELPDWRKNHKGNRNNHPSNVLAHLYLRALLGESDQDLERELELQSPWGLSPKRAVARENAGFYALLIGRNYPLVLRSWGGAGIRMAEYTADNRIARLEFNAQAPFVLVADANERVDTVTVNGKAIPFSQEEGVVTIPIPAGDSKIKIGF